jgi:hypothetical protein
VVNVMLGTISDVLSVISVLISAAAFGFAVYTWRRQSEVQGRLAAIEEDRRAEELASRAKADVVASFERRPSKRTKAEAGPGSLESGPGGREPSHR